MNRLLFQFPQSERTNCNLRARVRAPQVHSLSVSTIGTNELQRIKHKPPRELECRFQFPQSERTNCNCEKCLRMRRAKCLSVSTIGTNELQPLKTKNFHDGGKPFSFHNRNERTATLGWKTERSFALVFQFPQSERTNCNHNALVVLVVIGNLSVSTIGTNELQPDSVAASACARASFQFPQSERTNCNRAYADWNVDAWRLSVSTIGTNELQPLSSVLTIAQKFYFQFPQSERTNCNLTLSVSPNDSINAFSFHNRNERTATSTKSRFFFFERKLSVSTIGTNELQPRRPPTILPLPPHFQFPQSERTNCNLNWRMGWG